MLRRLIPAAIVSFFVAASAMAQATLVVQNSAAANFTNGAPTVTMAHTIPAATANNRLLLVGVHMNVNTPTGATVTSVSYGAQTLTLLEAITDAAVDTRTEVWYLLNPNTGTNNVSVTMGGVGAGQTVRGVIGAITYSGANQTMPSTIVSTNTGTTSPATSTALTSATNDTIVDFVSARESVTLTVNAAQTQNYNISNAGTSNNDVQAASSRRAAAAGTTTMSWTLSANRSWTDIAVNVRPAQADVELNESALPDPVAPGGILTYTFYVYNNGPSAANGVTVTDTLPGTVTFVSSTTTQGTCSGTTTVTCTVGTLTNGATASISIQVVAPLTGGAIAANTGTVTTTTVDPGTPNTASASSYSLVQATVCGTQPGKDGTPAAPITGVVNSYWPGTASAAAGATSITAGTRTGAANSITAGDLLLIIQMQDAAIDSTNDDRYGNGAGVAGSVTGIGAGYTNANNAGRYEYVVATNATAIGAAGGTITFTGVNGSGGLVYAYTNAAATATQGQRRFQVVRVPQYLNATLGAALTARPWGGTTTTGFTGGILAIDVAGQLTLNSATVSVNGQGFRGAAGIQQDGNGTAQPDDYRNAIATDDTHGIKGEGIAGSPELLFDSGATLDIGPQGYPNGDYGRGAPANAGGGGTDTGTVNDQNSGGGGGGNWGRGGGGGNAWQSNQARGGFGGAPFFDSPGRAVLGGGGGGGARNNSDATGDLGGSGAAGGGMVLIRAANLSGTATINANGADAYDDTLNDGGGGGGAGGSIVVLSHNGGINGLTMHADGGDGGDAWRGHANGGYPGERHGPGGGGAGGYIATNGTPNGASSVLGGTSGITTDANDTFGAQPGAVGTIVTTADFDQITGIKSGCTDISVAISDSPDPVGAGGNITYTESVTNNSTNIPAYGVTLTQTTPPGTTFVSMTPPAGWSCTTPAVGGTGTITCTIAAGTALAAGATTGNFQLVVKTSTALADPTTITQSVTTATTNPETNTANNTASTTTTVHKTDVQITKTGSPDPIFFGQTITYTLTAKNNGPTIATGVVVSDPIPSGVSFTNVSPGSPTCTFASGTVTCNYASLAVNATQVITITGTITVNTTQVTNTATVAINESETNTTNNSASFVSNVPAPTFARVLSLDAEQDGNGHVVVSWKTSFESDNLGFNLYRQRSGGEREKINPYVIAGSAFFTASRRLESGRSYQWKDNVDAGSFVQYWLEDVDLNGEHTMHGPITPVVHSGFTAAAMATVDAPTLANAAPLENGGIFVSARGFAAQQPITQVFDTRRVNQQYAILGAPAAKLYVTHEGWYRVTKSAIVAAGFDPGTVPDAVRLYVDGNECPIFVSDGGDGSFDANDAIEFYGTALDTPSSGAHAYFVTKGKGLPLRLRSDAGSRTATALPSNTSYTFERIERTVFFTALVNNGDRDNFFGAIVSSAPVTQDLTVEQLDASGAATLELTLQGATEVQHGIALTLNGAALTTYNFTGMTRNVKTVSIPASALQAGTNTLGITALGGDEDVSVVESVRLTYLHKLVADNNALKVIAVPGASVTVKGFTTNAIRAIDVTNSLDPFDVALVVRTSTGGTYTATASALRTGTAKRTLLFVGAPRVDAPRQIVSRPASTLNDKKNTADMVVIAPAEFASAAAPLKTRRDAEGISTKIVDVESLFDEFNFGVRGPSAIRDFLSSARKWKTAPRFALLVGDANVDPRNYLGFGVPDLVPTKLVPVDVMKTASDAWLADFNSDDIEDVAIGRLPARNASEAQTMINKVVQRGRGSDAAGAWTTKALFFTDFNDGYDFDGAATAARALTPNTLTSTTIAHDRTALLSSLNSGQLLATYFGHGSVDLWRNTFDSNDALALTNGQRQPVVFAMTCLNAYFHDLYQTSLGEALLQNPNGGAVAVWTSSALTQPDSQQVVAEEMFRQLFPSNRTLGEAAARAKAATADHDVRKSWILFGDPSMKLR
ncbi:MAG: DUF11 domain-containing protein [Acidobacteria bacterium]|nr:DUF11 domain-containing protein [Acidobacteriota bacterium]MBV9478054.1 DUF11 domain-containing protein [Acidobacteriota bacterium]